MNKVKIVIEKEPESMYHRFKGSLYVMETNGLEWFSGMIWFNSFEHSAGIYHFIENELAVFGIMDYRAEIVWAIDEATPEAVAAEALI